MSIVMMAYRSAVHETTSFTPCELMFSPLNDLPTDLQLGRPEQVACGRDKIEYVRDLQKSLDLIHAFPCEHLTLGSKTQKRCFAGP